MTTGGPIFLDVTRLLLRAGRNSPTGIDRVELAYAQELKNFVPERLSYVAVHPLGLIGSLPSKHVEDLIERVASAWSGQTTKAGGFVRVVQAQLLLHMSAFTPIRWRGIRATDSIYLNVSHQYLDKPRPILAFKSLGARIVCLVHDLIPIEWPEFVRPAAPARHRKRLQTLVNLADGIIFPSVATQQAARLWLCQAARAPCEAVIPLGITANGANYQTHSAPPNQKAETDEPYFVCLGTIEPRKNHLLLLHLWRRLAQSGKSRPRLYILGGRGWENENIIDMLDRAPFPDGMVVEISSPSDRRVHELLAGARALLFPTIAEGYGLPVTEALSLGVPVLCSDLAILREVGGNVPEYLDPFDFPEWLRAISDYTEAESPRRRAQLDRLRFWTAPNWDGHMRQALQLMKEVSST